MSDAEWIAEMQQKLDAATQRWEAWHAHFDAWFAENDRATARLSAVRAVLGERHTMTTGRMSETGPEIEVCFRPCFQRWPCLHERVRRAVEGE